MKPCAKGFVKLPVSGIMFISAHVSTLILRHCLKSLAMSSVYGMVTITIFLSTGGSAGSLTWFTFAHTLPSRARFSQGCLRTCALPAVSCFVLLAGSALVVWSSLLGMLWPNVLFCHICGMFCSLWGSLSFIGVAVLHSICTSILVSHWVVLFAWAVPVFARCAICLTCLVVASSVLWELMTRI